MIKYIIYISKNYISTKD